MLLVGCSSVPVKKTWELQDGRWPEVTTSNPSTQPVNEPDLDRAEGMLFRGDYKGARQVLLDWERTHKSSPVRDRCIYLIAESYMPEERITAFYYCDEVMDEYPDSRFFYPALETQYQIADEFLKGYKRYFLGMQILGAEDEAIEMLYRIQQRSPGSPLAERCLLRTADWYFDDAEYDLAADGYGSYIRSFPRSDKIPRVKLRRAFSALAQFRGLKFDATAMIDARAELVDIQHAYPDLAEEEHVEDVIARIDDAFARKILDTGDFYQRTSEPRAAVYQYRYLAETYPNSPEAKVANQRLAQMPASAKIEPPPPAGEGYSPATQPSAAAQ